MDTIRSSREGAGRVQVTDTPARPIRYAVSFVVRADRSVLRTERGVAGAPRTLPAAVLAVRRPRDDEELPGLWGLPAASLRPGESWWEAVHRAARDKLGLRLDELRLVHQGSAERDDHVLRMRLFEARLAEGRPSVARATRDPGVTRYTSWGWLPPERLREAAERGSLCTRLCLERIEEARRGSDGPGPAPEVNPLAVTGVVTRGHGVASGEGPSPFLPGGTIRAQLPAFLERGLDLSDVHPATLNVSLAPRGLGWERPRITFRDVRWHPELPVETFSFSPCRVAVADPDRVASGESSAESVASAEAGPPGRTDLAGWLYRPHPETKPRHRQPADVVEVMTRRLAGAGPGTRLRLELDPWEMGVAEGE